MLSRSISPRSLVVALAAAFAACSDSPAQPDSTVIPPVAGTQTVTLTAGAAAAEYTAVLVNSTFTGTDLASYSIRADGVSATAYVADGEQATASRSAYEAVFGAPLSLNREWESRLRDRERLELTPKFAGAREWYAARQRADAASPAGLSPQRRSNVAIPADVKVGDVVRINVNGNDACANPTYRGARVTAIGRRSIVLDDTLNPKNGFTDADFVRFAARFDTLVYPLDSAAFGAATDIDANGRIALVFTRAVNELTPANSGSYVGGFTFSRDLFPLVASARLSACAASNEGEYFYLLTPDPQGDVNGNVRRTGFVDSVTTSVIAHELQHLINAGRRLYINTAATSLETKWLDEGLAHMAEELLFYRESGLASRTNLGIAAIRASNQSRLAYNTDMAANASRYRSYLQAPQKSSPYAPNDSLTTRGAAWSLLRYAADRTQATDGDIFFRLVNSTTTGIPNATAVFGAGFGDLVRDWQVSHAVDDIVPTAAYQQLSWNWHDIFPNLGAGGLTYPLSLLSMVNATAYSGTVLSGGATYFKLTVPANGSANLVLTETTTGTKTLRLVTVRTK